MDEVAAFYKGKRITFIVPNAPGGGYDQYARMIAPFLAKYTGATFVIKNMEGAGGLTSMNTLYRAPKDGLTIGIINGSAMVTNVIAEVPGVIYQLDKYGWLGRIVQEPRVFIVRTASPIKTIHDLLNSKEVVKIGATGLGGSSYVYAVIVGEALGMNIDIIHGFDSWALLDPALIRGDVEGGWGPWASRRSSVENGFSRVILQSGMKRMTDFPNIPTYFELAKTDRARSILTVLETLTEFDRLMATSPGIPQERLAFLRDAFDKAMKDPDFIAEATRARRALDYESGATMQEMATSIVIIPPDIRRIFERAIKGSL